MPGHEVAVAELSDAERIREALPLARFLRALHALRARGRRRATARSCPSIPTAAPTWRIASVAPSTGWRRPSGWGCGGPRPRSTEMLEGGARPGPTTGAGHAGPRRPAHPPSAGRRGRPPERGDRLDRRVPRRPRHRPRRLLELRPAGGPGRRSPPNTARSTPMRCCGRACWRCSCARRWRCTAASRATRTRARGGRGPRPVGGGMSGGWSVVHLDGVEAIPWRGTELVWRPVRTALGTRIVGMAAYTAERVGQEVVEDHIEDRDGRGHDEVYVVLRGRATLPARRTRSSMRRQGRSSRSARRAAARGRGRAGYGGARTGRARDLRAGGVGLDRARPAPYARPSGAGAGRPRGAPRRAPGFSRAALRRGSAARGAGRRGRCARLAARGDRPPAGPARGGASASRCWRRCSRAPGRPATRAPGRPRRPTPHRHDLELRQIVPLRRPALEQRRVVGLHELEAAAEAVLDPALDVAQAVGQHPAAVAGPLVDGPRALREGLDDHVSHAARTVPALPSCYRSATPPRNPCASIGV